MRDKTRIISRKSNARNIVFIILFLFFITIGVGYSYLKQSLNIYGKASIVNQNVSELKNGNSKYSWSIDNKIEEEYITYEVTLNILNLDKDSNSWILSFDVPNSFEIEKSEIKNSAQLLYKDGRVIVTSEDYISKNDEIELSLKLCFKDNQNFYINNLALNNLLAKNE